MNDAVAVDVFQRRRLNGREILLKFANKVFEFVFSAMAVSSSLFNWNYSSLNELKIFNVAFWTKYRWHFRVVCRFTRRLGTSSTVGEISVCGFSLLMNKRVECGRRWFYEAITWKWECQTSMERSEFLHTREQFRPRPPTRTE